MATITASAAQSTAQARYLEAGTVARSIVFNNADYGAALSAGDVIQMLKVPVGAVITNVVGAMESQSGLAGVITVNIGDGNDTSRYGASVVFSSSVVHTTVPARGFGYSYSAADTIDLVVAAVSAASAAGKITLVVHYTNANKVD